MKSLTSILLAFMILTSNVGITFATHFCGGKAVETKVLIANINLGCTMPDKPSCSDSETEGTTFKSEPCCTNTFVQLEIEDAFDASEILNDLVRAHLIATFIGSYNQLFPNPADQAPPYLNYSPPLLSFDIPVLVQVFLI